MSSGKLGRATTATSGPPPSVRNGRSPWPGARWTRWARESSTKGLRFSRPERRIADYVANEGAAVVAIHDGYGRDGRKPDALVDDTKTEFKSLDPGAGNNRVKALLNDAKGQAKDALLDARNSGLSREEAELGIERFLGSKYGHRLDAIRIIGDDYDINWKRD
jgi:Contact-dependent growth inhibition CdiA C-terminal domain